MSRCESSARGRFSLASFLPVRYSASVFSFLFLQYIFSSDLKGYQRKKVHEIADYLACLEHVSIGKGPTRFLKVCCVCVRVAAMFLVLFLPHAS